MYQLPYDLSCLINNGFLNLCGSNFHIVSQKIKYNHGRSTLMSKYERKSVLLLVRMKELTLYFITERPLCFTERGRVW